ncbi:MAG: hypothetical protein HYV97_08650 [Bdellovibrio sp.]|nr:hypothetical protein [Bdellovibrio sp.]
MLIFKIRFFTFTVFLIAGLIWLAGCVPSSGGSNTRKGKSTSQSTGSGTSGAPTNNPTFVEPLNYLQNGSVISSASFTLDLTFSDSFYLRGAEVHQYLASGNLDVMCLAFNFPSLDGSSKTLVLAGNPRSFFNFSSKIKENYFLVEPANRSLNSTFCQTPGPLNYVGLNFPTSTLAYALGDICTNCSSFLLDSSPLELISLGGKAIKNIQTHYLDLRVKTQGTQTSNTSGTSCINSSECTSLGFDCCSGGQCVKDLTLKTGVDTSSSEYIQAQNEITSLPSNIYNYPNFYHICSKQISATPTPVVTENPFDAATARLTMLQELYECTSPILGEMSVCTVTYQDANKNKVLSNFTGFVTGADDRSFETTHKGVTPIAKHSIYEVIHAGSTIFKSGPGSSFSYVDIPQFSSGSQMGGWNDDLTNSARVVLNRAKPTSALNDDLKIKFMIDGSCTYVNSHLAKCYKYYVQGQPYGDNDVPPQLNDHYPASNKFLLPLYADIGRSIKVEVDGTIKTASVDWNIVEASPSYIQFVGTSVQVQDTQTVKIEFFVDLDSNNVMQSKLTALNSIDQLCNCGGPYCTLKPVTAIQNGVTKILDYTCVYPQPTTVEAPMQQTVYLSTQTVPHRYFDKSGVHHTTVKNDTPEQENSSNGAAFEYTSGNILRPNNLTQYVGFNEIYGSFRSAANNAKPAREVVVKSGKTYDIFIDYGSFSTCSLCGTDYYASLVKIFPTNFAQKGGGYRPEINKTDRFKVSTYRADDLLFGRACFVPATMIPWTHAKNTVATTQRRNRLAAQHFLFANGYQRDWYGFDYGAVIASFDGVAWFAVGNQRRIKATGNRLYLAVNAYFGDQTLDSIFTITINEANLTLGSGSQITVDDQSDGAECRKYHQCETDSDCIGQLGWDYTCENVGLIKTTWPAFDSNGVELPDQERTGVPMSSLLAGEIAGQRCVYRGRGAVCHPKYDNIVETTTYNQVGNGPTSGNGGLLACAPNFYCQAFLDGTDQALFNNRISRFAKSPAAQNLSSDVPETDMDTFGLAARFIGRPYRYNGTEVIYSGGARSSMARNNVVALCIPGKDPGSATTTFVANNYKKPTASAEEKFDGDQVLNIGMSSKGNTKALHYLSGCGILNDDLNYIYKANPEWTMGDVAVNMVPYLAASQVTTTNMLGIFNSSNFNDIELTKSFAGNLIESFTYQPNRCLRMPGSVCFSDQDCAANRDIATPLSEADPEQSIFDGSSNLNSFELRFWQNELICGQGVAKTNPTYDLKKNRCCRDLGKDFKIAHGMTPTPATFTNEAPNIRTSISQFAPITEDIGGNQRNSQMATYINEMITIPSSNGSGHPALLYPVQATSDCATCASLDSMLKQFNTIQTLGAKMCCSGHWVRQFHEENGGGHKWEATKFQNFPTTTLRCMNWEACEGTGSGGSCGGDGTPESKGGFTCSHVTDPADTKCLIKSTSKDEAFRFFDYLGRFELLGIPQVPILSKTDAAKDPDGAAYNYLRCRVDPANQDNPGSAATILPKLIETATDDEDIAKSGTGYYSAADMTDFDEQEGIRPIFSPDTLSCCKPAGTTMDVGEDSNNCCTGFVNASQRRCVLPFWTDVTTYTNKYVSSALKDLDLTNTLSGENKTIYEETGYILDINIIIAAACTLKLCDGDTLAAGVSWGPYNIPPFASTSCTGSLCKLNRFIQDDNEESGLSPFFKAGLRWNSHIYCVPSDNNTAQAITGQGGILIRCNQ